MREKTRQDLSDLDKGKDQNADKHHDEQKARAAAFVVAAALSDVLDCKWDSVLKGIDRLMLRAVVLENTGNVLDPRNQKDIQQEKTHADQTFDQAHQIMMFRCENILVQ